MPAMSRKWVLFLCAVIMLALALVVARVFREPLPPLSGEDVAQVGDSVSGPLQAAPQTPLPSPLPSPEAMIMSSGDSGDLPVTHVEPQAEGPTGVAPVVKDSTFGSVQVTEPPASFRRSCRRKPEDGDKAPSSSSASPPEHPARETDKSRGSTVPAPEKIEPAAQSAPSSTSDKPEVTPPSASAGPEVEGKPASSPASAPTPAAPAASDKGGKADKPLKPGTLVTKSSLPAKAGGQVVTSAVLTMDGDVVTLNLKGTSAMRGEDLMLVEPDRVVLDIEGDWKVEAPRVPSNRMVRALRVGSQDTATRLVFDMRVKPVKVKVTNPDADSLELTIR